MVLSIAAEEVLGKIRTATRQGKLRIGGPHPVLQEAAEARIITAEEADLVRRAELARAEYVQVDAFTLDEYNSLRLGAEGNSAFSIAYPAN
jgi:acyl-CoA dehydrogenase